MRAENPTKGYTLGVILAGGRGRRLGGAHKALIDLAGWPMIRRVIDRIAPQVDDLVINANGNPTRYAAFGLEILRDHPDPETGPLAGPAAGLVTAIAFVRGRRRETGQGWRLLTVPTDTPFLPDGLVAKLAEALAAHGAPLAYAASADRDHPVIALWTEDAFQPVRTRLKTDPNVSLHALVEGLSGARVSFPAEPFDPFFNVNTPRDLEAACRYLRCEPL